MNGSSSKQHRFNGRNAAAPEGVENDVASLGVLLDVRADNIRRSASEIRVDAVMPRGLLPRGGYISKNRFDIASVHAAFFK